MSVEPEGWSVNARPAVIALGLFVAVLLAIVIGSAHLYSHRYAARTRPHVSPFPAPELERIDSAPTDRRATPSPLPPKGIDRAMAETAARGDALWRAR